MIKKLLQATVASLALASGVQAQDCNAPPFGSSPTEYTLWMDNFGYRLWRTEDRANFFLRRLCEAKFYGARPQREALHKMGITDSEIHAMTMQELRARFVREFTVDRER
jgi:hypothetical protein